MDVKLVQPDGTMLVTLDVCNIPSSAILAIVISIATQFALLSFTFTRDNI